MKIYHPEPPHFALFAQCLDAVKRGTPFVLEGFNSNGCWHTYFPGLDGLPDVIVWRLSNIRIKPPEPVMITRTVTYPAPMTVAPEIGTEYFALESSLVASYTWAGDSVDQAALTQGRAFTHEADAQACWDALFGAKK